MRIPLKDIYISPDRQRTVIDTGKLNELKDDISENGQIQAITVRPTLDSDRRDDDYSGEPWVLVAGGRRCLAVALLGWPDIEGYAREEMSVLTAEILELHENIKRESMTWQEEVEAKSRIVRLRKVETPDITGEEIAKSLGMSGATLSRDLKTAELVRDNPGLAKASTKKAALNAGKLIEAGESRARIAKSSAALNAEIPPLTDRVVTSRAEDFLPTLETHSVDLVLIDGPYGYDFTTWVKDGTESRLSEFDDSFKAAAQTYRDTIPEAVRALRVSGWFVAFASAETYEYIRDLLSDCCAEHRAYRSLQYPSRCELATKLSLPQPCRFLTPNKYPWIWYRPNSRNNPRHPYLHAKTLTEFILVCNMGKGRLTSPCNNILIHDNEYGAGRVHANQKPIPLYEDLIRRFTFPGDTVVDYFFGSGNSLAAAAKLSRIPRGSEQNPELLQFAHSAIRREEQPITKSIIEAAHDRYLQAIRREVAADDNQDLDSNDGNDTPRPVEYLRPVGVWSYETMPLAGEWLGIIKYSGHNLDQTRTDTEEEIEGLMMQYTEIYETLTALGRLDPQTCSPEEAQASLREWLGSMKEEPV